MSRNSNCTETQKYLDYLIIFFNIKQTVFSENTNLYREIIKVVRHFIRRNYSRLRRMYRVRWTKRLTIADIVFRLSVPGGWSRKNKDCWENKSRLERSTTSSRMSPHTPCSMILMEKLIWSLIWRILECAWTNLWITTFTWWRKQLRLMAFLSVLLW